MTGRRALKIHVCDFSSDFVPEKDIFLRLLAEDYDLVLTDQAPDYVLYSCYGTSHLDFDAVRIFYASENVRPDFNLCDFAITFEHMAYLDRHLRFPAFARYGEQFDALCDPRAVDAPALAARTGFCNFIYANPHADPARDRFFHLLSARRTVDSPGRHLNNMAPIGDRYAPDWRQSKLPFMRNYRFTIAFENASSPGYVSEKILHAFIAGTIPIYWGDPMIETDFNPAAFVNCHRYDSLEAAAEAVMALDADPDRMLAMMNAPPFVGNRTPEHLSLEAVRGFFRHIFDQPLDQARRRPRYGAAAAYEQQMRRYRRLSSLAAAIPSPAQRVLRGVRRLAGRMSAK